MSAFHERRNPEGLLDRINRLTARGEELSDEEFNDDGQSPSSSRHSSPSKTRSDRRSHSMDGSESDSDHDDQLSSDGKQKKVNRPHVTARRRIKSSSKAIEKEKEKGEEEDGAMLPINDPLMRSEATAGRNASPPRIDDGPAGGERGAEDVEGTSLCLISGVTSRALELFMIALLYRAHKTISHTCSLFKR